MAGSSISPSEELREIVRRFYRAVEAADGETLRGLFSTEPYALAIGSDPDEWWRGNEALAALLLQIREMPGLVIEEGEIIAYCSGNVGWSANLHMMRFANGLEFASRLTMVFAIEGGHWRIVQFHGSIGRANEEIVGVPLTTNVAHIVESVRAGRSDVGPGSAPDGTVTIVFSDIESSSVLNERLGDTEFMRLLAWHDRIVRETAEQHRGFVVKSEGDGFMLAFPSSAFALRSCLVTRDRLAAGFNGLPVRVRTGLHAGEALRHDDDFYGRTVVIAARIGALALGQEILASGLVHALVRGLGTFAFGDGRTVTLKGLDGAFEVYPVLA